MFSIFRKSRSAVLMQTTSGKIHVPVENPVEIPKQVSSATNFSAGICVLDGAKREDRIIAGVTVFRDIVMYAVIDGHGGSDTADYLKKTLPQAVTGLCEERSSFIRTMEEDPDEYENILSAAFKLCADEWDRGAYSARKKRAGAVCTVVLVQKQTCIVAHVGDGRVVAATSLAHMQLTKVHHASEPVERDRIESYGVPVLHGRVGGVLMPSRVFGDLNIRERSDGTFSDCVSPIPDVFEFHVDLEGFLVVSSDGVNDVLRSSEAAEIVRRSLSVHQDPNLAARELAYIASNHSPDDISVIVLTWR